MKRGRKSHPDPAAAYADAAALVSASWAAYVGRTSTRDASVGLGDLAPAMTPMTTGLLGLSLSILATVNAMGGDADEVLRRSCLVLAAKV